jgi:hypothetical protein
MAKDKRQAFIGIAIAVIFAILLLSSIMLLRISKGYLPYANSEAYYNLRISSAIENNFLFFEDLLQDRPYHHNPFHYTVAALMKIIPDSLEMFIPIIFGVISLIFLYKLLKTLGIHEKNAALSVLVFCATPVFIISFSSLNRLGFTAMLSIVALSLFFEKNYWDSPWLVSGKVYFGLSIVILCLLAMTSLAGFIITVIFMAGLCALEGRSFQSLIFAALVPLLILLPLSVYTDYLQVSLREFALERPELRNVFSVLGARMGLDLFLFILFITGMVILWNFIKELRLYHFLAVIFIIASFLSPILRVYASLIICPYCVVAIKHLYYRKWELETIKAGTLLLVACALLFSVLNQANSLASEEPGPEAIQILDSLKDLPQGIVMSEPQYGSLIEYYSGKRVMLDESSSLYPNYHETLGDYDYILGLTRLKDAQPMLEKHGIKYIIITPAHKQERWEGKERELLLILKNSNAFTLLDKTNSGFELWKYEGNVQNTRV